MEKEKETKHVARQVVMSGIRPTGYLHLGNYVGAIRNYVRMQEEYECYFMVADLHSLTTHPDTTDLKTNVFRVLAENIARRPRSGKGSAVLPKPSASNG